MHYWADLQSVHGFRCYDNIALNAKCQRVHVVVLCLVGMVIQLNVRPYLHQVTKIEVSFSAMDAVD